MVLSAARSKNGGKGGGTGFYFIFFSDDENFSSKRSLLSLAPSADKSTRSPTATTPLISGTRLILSICSFLILATFLLFTFSTFEPAAPFRPSSRRLLLTNYSNSQKQSTTTVQPPPHINQPRSTTDSKKRKNTALQGMGTLYRRGTKSMSDLIVGHVKEDVTEAEFRSFIRLIHHNGLLSHSDLILLFPSPSSAANFSSVVEEENESFVKLVSIYREMKNSTRRDPVFGRYLKTNTVVGNHNRKKEKKPIWGRDHWGELTHSSSLYYGSFVGFDASELDPENSLSGFLDHVPLKLRRWACYPMLLGRVRRNYKHTILVDIKDVLILRDPLTRIRGQSPASVLLFRSESSKHGRKNSDQHGEPMLSSGIIVGGSRGVRKFADTVLNEIVRARIERKGSSVSESGLVNRLGNSGYVLKDIILVEPVELIGEASSLRGLNSLSLVKDSCHHSVVGGGNENIDVIETVICSTSDLYTSVYTDCLAPNKQKAIGNRQ